MDAPTGLCLQPPAALRGCPDAAQGYPGDTKPVRGEGSGLWSRSAELTVCLETEFLSLSGGLLSLCWPPSLSTELGRSDKQLWDS